MRTMIFYFSFLLTSSVTAQSSTYVDSSNLFLRIMEITLVNENTREDFSYRSKEIGTISYDQNKYGTKPYWSINISGYSNFYYVDTVFSWEGTDRQYLTYSFVPSDNVLIECKKEGASYFVYLNNLTSKKYYIYRCVPVLKCETP